MSKASESPDMGNCTDGILVQWRGLWGRITEDMEAVTMGGVEIADEAAEEWGGPVNDALALVLLRNALNSYELQRVVDKQIGRWVDDCEFWNADYTHSREDY